MLVALPKEAAEKHGRRRVATYTLATNNAIVPSESVALLQNDDMDIDTNVTLRVAVQHWIEFDRDRHIDYVDIGLHRFNGTNMCQKSRDCGSRFDISADGQQIGHLVDSQSGAGKLWRFHVGRVVSRIEFRLRNSIYEETFALHTVHAYELVNDQLLVLPDHQHMHVHDQMVWAHLTLDDEDGQMMIYRSSSNMDKYWHVNVTTTSGLLLDSLVSSVVFQYTWVDRALVGIMLKRPLSADLVGQHLLVNLTYNLHEQSQLFTNPSTKQRFEWSSKKVVVTAPIEPAPTATLVNDVYDTCLMCRRMTVQCVGCSPIASENDVQVSVGETPLPVQVLSVTRGIYGGSIVLLTLRFDSVLPRSVMGRWLSLTMRVTVTDSSTSRETVVTQTIYRATNPMDVRRDDPPGALGMDLVNGVPASQSGIIRAVALQMSESLASPYRIDNSVSALQDRDPSTGLYIAYKRLDDGSRISQVVLDLGGARQLGGIFIQSDHAMRYCSGCRTSYFSQLVIDVGRNDTHFEQVVDFGQVLSDDLQEMGTYRYIFDPAGPVDVSAITHLRIRHPSGQNFRISELSLYDNTADITALGLDCDRSLTSTEVRNQCKCSSASLHDVPEVTAQAVDNEFDADAADMTLASVMSSSSADELLDMPKQQQQQRGAASRARGMSVAQLLALVGATLFAISVSSSSRRTSSPMLLSVIVVVALTASATTLVAAQTISPAGSDYYYQDTFASINPDSLINPSTVLPLYSVSRTDSGSTRYLTADDSCYVASRSGTRLFVSMDLGASFATSGVSWIYFSGLCNSRNQETDWAQFALYGSHDNSQFVLLQNLETVANHNALKRVRVKPVVYRYYSIRKLDAIYYGAGMMYLSLSVFAAAKDFTVRNSLRLSDLSRLSSQPHYITEIDIEDLTLTMGSKDETDADSFPNTLASLYDDDVDTGIKTSNTGRGVDNSMTLEAYGGIRTYWAMLYLAYTDQPEGIRVECGLVDGATTTWSIVSEPEYVSTGQSPSPRVEIMIHTFCNKVRVTGSETAPLHVTAMTATKKELMKTNVSQQELNLWSNSITVSGKYTVVDRARMEIVLRAGDRVCPIGMTTETATRKSVASGSSSSTRQTISLLHGEDGESPTFVGADEGADVTVQFNIVDVLGNVVYSPQPIKIGVLRFEPPRLDYEERPHRISVLSRGVYIYGHNFHPISPKNEVTLEIFPKQSGRSPVMPVTVLDGDGSDRHMFVHFQRPLTADDVDFYFKATIKNELGTSRSYAVSSPIETSVFTGLEILKVPPRSAIHRYELSVFRPQSNSELSWEAMNDLNPRTAIATGRTGEVMADLGRSKYIKHVYISSADGSASGYDYTSMEGLAVGVSDDINAQFEIVGQFVGVDHRGHWRAPIKGRWRYVKLFFPETDDDAYFDEAMTINDVDHRVAIGTFILSTDGESSDEFQVAGANACGEIVQNNVCSSACGGIPDDGLSAGEIAGIVIGSLFGVCLLGALCFALHQYMGRRPSANSSASKSLQASSQPKQPKSRKRSLSSKKPELELPQTKNALAVPAADESEHRLSLQATSLSNNAHSMNGAANDMRQKLDTSNQGLDSHQSPESPLTGVKWTGVFDANANAYYYIENATQNVQWERPIDFDGGGAGAGGDMGGGMGGGMGESFSMAGSMMGASTSGASAFGINGNGGQSVQDLYKAEWDAASGKYYYVNRQTLESQWVRPPGFVDPPMNVAV